MSPQLHAIEFTAADIFRIDLRKHGLTARAVAKELGVHEGHLSRVIHGHLRSGRLRSALAQRFGNHYLSLLQPWSDHGREAVAGQSAATVQYRNHQRSASRR